MSSDNIPAQYLCPINQTIMVNPVMCPDGYTYEDQAIREWLRNHNTSPITRTYMDSSRIVPNRALKDLIDEYNAQQLQNTTSTNNNVGLGSSIITVPTIEIIRKFIKSPFNGMTYEYICHKPIGDYKDHRVPITCFGIIDVSGSMDSICSITDSVNTETDNLTRLDLIKYALQTIISMLNDNDTLVLVKFSDRSSKIFSGQMNQVNKARAKSVVESLQTEGSTNIWDSLKTAYDDVIANRYSNVKMLLLTDGEANINPPMGILPTFKRYLDKNPNVNVELTTFGFSYDVDSKSLFDLCEMTGSSFNFIPDASMVGTTFINYLANSLNSSYEKHLVNPVTTIDGIDETNLTDFNMLSHDEQYEIIRQHVYEFLRDICFETDSKNRIVTASMTEKYMRLKHIIEHLKDTNRSKLLTELYRDFCSPLNKTNDEQITKAITNNEWFKKWGYHYLLSLSSAHKIRKCHNFKDCGVQMYGNEYFSELRDEINDIFCSLPPPIPSGRSNSYNRYGYGSMQPTTQTSQPINMTRYLNNSGGCFANWCRIKLFDGSYKRLDELNGSEMLFVNNSDQNDVNTAGRIKYVIKTKVPNSQTNMCKIGDLFITNWHPIKYGDTWVFPNQVTNVFAQNIDWYYNIILEQTNNLRPYSVIIENIECITMAHNIVNFDDTNDILQHNYFGNDSVTRDLECFIVTGQTSNIITVENYQIIRGNDSRICGIIRG
jgi:hypothetical protein